MSLPEKHHLSLQGNILDITPFLYPTKEKTTSTNKIKIQSFILIPYFSKFHHKKDLNIKSTYQLSTESGS